MEARSFPYDRGKTGWAAAAAAVRFATRQEEAETAVLRTLGVRSSDDWRTAPNTFIIERYRDTFTPVDCGRATNQVHRPKVKREKIQVPKCIRLIDKTRHRGSCRSSRHRSSEIESDGGEVPMGERGKEKGK